MRFMFSLNWELRGKQVSILRGPATVIGEHRFKRKQVTDVSWEDGAMC